MAQESDELRQQIDSQRAEISGTVSEIENRVRPSRIAARSSDRLKHRMTGWRDAVFGGADDRRSPYGDESGYGYGTTGYGTGGDGSSENGMAHRASDAASSAADSIRHSPEFARRETRGNPLAAGAIALGAGWLVAGLLPESRQERKLVQRAEPKLAEAAATAKSEGAAVAEEMREPAKEAAKELQDTSKDAARHVKEGASGSS